MTIAPFKKVANDTGKVLTLQAALTGAVAVFLSHNFSVTPAEVAPIASLISLVAVWLARRVINRYDADEAAKEPTRALALLRDDCEQRAMAMDDNDPRRPQLMRQASDLQEEIFQRTVETKYVVIPDSSGSSPRLPAPPAE